MKKLQSTILGAICFIVLSVPVAAADTLPCEADVFAHESINQAYVSRVERAYIAACEFFGGLDAPLEIWISARDRSHQQELIVQWCERRKLLEGRFNQCRRSQIGGSNYNSWQNLKHAYHHINLEKFSDSRRDPSAEYVAIHEYFHAWQATQIGQMETPEYIMGLKLGKLRDGSRPWFSEGGATYLSHYVWSLETQASRNHLRDEMERYFDRSRHAFNDLYDGKLSIKELRYGEWNEGGEDAYNISTWAIAYLIDLVGLETFIAMHGDLREKTFEQAFSDHFGMTSDEFDRLFRAFVSSPEWANRSSILL